MITTKYCKHRDINQHVRVCYGISLTTQNNIYVFVLTLLIPSLKISTPFFEKRSTMKKNDELELAFDFVQNTNRNIFLTGKAGTGKTTFLKSLKVRSHKRMVVVAPTGVAAINAGGVTIHSFFQLPFGPIITEKVAGHRIENPNFKGKFNRRKINIIKSLDLLVIDEISMVRADILDAIDEVLRRYKNRYQPFGGVQLLMIGDLQQLAPVVKDDEWKMLQKYYSSMFFFNSKALDSAQMLSIELKHVYRQSDGVFLKILNEIRNDNLSKKSFDILHQRYIPNFQPKNEDGYINLTTHNHSAQKINDIQLEKIHNPTKRFTAITKGTFSEYSYPTLFNLELKVGAQVMFIKNDSSPEKRYFNGKIGKITAFEEENILVECEGDEEIIYTSKEIWENIKYSINEKSKEIEEEVVGSFMQYPLRLAWAITIHKSQGLTFEKAVIDAAGAFSHGQTYVALSRCKTLEGLILSSKIPDSAIICNKEVSLFNENVEKNQPSREELNNATNFYQLELIEELFNYKQLNYQVNRAINSIYEHKESIQGDILEFLQKIDKEKIPEIAKIANSFLSQVSSLAKENSDIENNEFLQERIKKAANYFYKFNQEKIIEALNKSSFETGNKAAKKAVSNRLSTINEILVVKQNCFNCCFQGFVLKDFLSVRAKSHITVDEKTKKVKLDYRDVETKHPDLYSILKMWRKDEYEAKMLVPFQVATNKSLQEIANELPVTIKQLKDIHGVGKKKIEQYGDVLISIVADYVEDRGLEKRDDKTAASKSQKKIKLEKPNEEIKKPKKSNHEKSFELYKSGKTISEIAEELGFVQSTIENHLCRYIVSGDLKIEEFVEQSTLEKLLEYFKKNPKSSISDAKAALPYEISYSQIRFAQKQIEFLETLKSKTI